MINEFIISRENELKLKRSSLAIKERKQIDCVDGKKCEKRVDVNDPQTALGPSSRTKNTFI